MKKTVLFLTGLAFTSAAFGGTIISDTNSSGSAFGLDAVSWTQTTTWTGVTIAAPLEDSSGSVAATGTAYLMTQIGPGTTSGNEIGSPFAISLTNTSFVVTTLFSGLTLGPGTYYLVINGLPNAGSTNLLWSAGATTQTLDPSVTQNGDEGSNGTLQSFQNLNKHSLLFTVTGTQSTTPEPAAAGLAALGLAGFGLLLRRKRN